ncbi:ATP-binding protein [Deinococcus yavapaiensis]|uniref:Putative ATPase n=1 Tax=Deinococcus yavapaiensis KR-236 TaxID=694435 RepID=A0A318SQP7_9DEIO|nr:LuxR C-terminal-related transcriptional regulator [Deinococcus yavapaiensis]PYE55193.1 putative ATPase [Deinococcus yavapaiensis KR-236]
MTSSDFATNLPSSPPSSWPVANTPLVGRAAEVDDVRSLLERPDVSLVTVTGPGGVGKTRLAAAVAARAPWPAIIVPLAAVGAEAQVLFALTSALGVEHLGNDPASALAAFLKERQLLLVLDNFEHLLGAAPLIAHLTAQAPSVKFLATSRAPLRLTSEWEYALEPLALPDKDAAWQAETLRDVEAVQLFVDRARAVAPEFELTDQNAREIAAITRQLDGLPLALELAAARVRLMPPAEMLTRLARPLPLLRGGPRDAPERQKTLRATLDWSFHLLTASQQRLLAHLSVFAGSFTVDAAEVVSGSSDVLDEISALSEQSLVRSLRTPDATSRFALLETIREYAREKLAASGEEQAALQRHAEYYVSLAERAEPHLRGHTQMAWLPLLDAEHDNTQAVISRALEARTPDVVGRLAWGLWYYWWQRNRHVQGLQDLRAALEQEFESEFQWARALFAAGGMAYLLGDFEWATWCAERGLPAMRRSGDLLGIGHYLAAQGTMAMYQGAFDAAEQMLREAAEAYEAFGSAWGVGYVELGRARMALLHGEIERASSFAERAVAFTRESGERYYLTFSLQCLALVRSVQGRHDEAEEALREALGFALETGDQGSLAYVLEGFAVLEAGRGHVAAAGEWLGSAQTVRAESFVAVTPTEDALYAQLFAPLRASFASAFEQAQARGRLSSGARAAERLRSGAAPFAESGEVRAAPEVSGPPVELSPRELDVLRLIAAGQTNPQIARELDVKPVTVATHVRSILHKLNVPSRTAAARWAFDHGLV